MAKCYANDKADAIGVWLVDAVVRALVCERHAKGAVSQGMMIRRFGGR